MNEEKDRPKSEERREREEAEMVAWQTALRDQRDEDIREVARRCTIFLRELKEQGVPQHEVGTLLIAYASSENGMVHEEWKRREEG